MWVPMQLTQERKSVCLDICQHLLNCYNTEDDFLRCIITGDKTLIHCYDPEGKHLNTEWTHPQSPVKNNVQNATNSEKSDTQCFGDS